MSLSSARKLASQALEKVQKKSMKWYDQDKAAPRFLRTSDWVLVWFPAIETGKKRMLAYPWHGSYQIVLQKEPDVSIQDTGQTDKCTRHMLHLGWMASLLVTTGMETTEIIQEDHQSGSTSWSQRMVLKAMLRTVVKSGANLVEPK